MLICIQPLAKQKSYVKAVLHLYTFCNLNSPNTVVQGSHEIVDLEGSYRRKIEYFDFRGVESQKCPSWGRNRSQYTAVRVAHKIKKKSNVLI